MVTGVCIAIMADPLGLEQFGWRDELVLGRDQREFRCAGGERAPQQAEHAGRRARECLGHRAAAEVVIQEQCGDEVAGAVARGGELRRADEILRGAVGGDDVDVAGGRLARSDRGDEDRAGPRAWSAAMAAVTCAISAVSRPARRSSSKWLGVTICAAGTARSRKNSDMPGCTNTPRARLPITGSQQ